VNADRGTSRLLSRLAAPRSRALARSWYLVTAVVGGAALIVQVAVSMTTLPHPPTTRLITVLGLFSVQSAILAVIAAGLLAADRPPYGRVRRVLQLDGLVGITVTGVLYLIVLRPVVALQGWAAVADLGLHYLLPLLAVSGWVLFGPRGRVGRGDVLAALIWPIAWFAWTYLHGAATGWYPYPFVDVMHSGYLATLGRTGVVLAALLGLAAGARLLDRRLLRAVRHPNP
jgi:hypothetical protein